MTLFRFTALVFLLCVTLDLHDPTVPGVFFAEHDALFVDAVTRAPGLGDDVHAGPGGARVPTLAVRDAADEQPARIPAVAARRAGDGMWRPAARRVPPHRVAPPDPDAL